MKKTALLLLLTLLLIFTCSCSYTRTLKFNSIGLEINKLKSEELKIDIYSIKAYTVNIINEELYVEKYNGEPNSKLIAVDIGYYVGVNVGEFGGWVVYCPHNKDFESNGVIVVEENFQGFIQVDNIKVLLLTGLAHLGTDKGKLYMLEKGNATELYDFGSMPQTFVWSEETLYVFTLDKLYSYKPGETPFVLMENNTYYNMCIKSAVKLGNSIYCGGKGGIYEYCLDTGMEYWYPIK
ncbi:MAG: hypothetical protein CVU97_05445 [Firmicutes bacterium HGW-Firmicutes-21]|nr:MAG: hypothetical protein CVU97_05445 [Firmicutes bacterium HGW-Firmicutes-21]